MENQNKENSRGNIITSKQESNEFFEYTDKADTENSISFKIKNIMCIGAGYVGILTMSVLANYYPGIKIQVFDKFRTTLERWTKAGKAFKKFNKEESNTPYTKHSPKLPIIEKSLEKLFLNSFETNLFFTDNLTDEDISKTDLVFICVNTPSTTYSKIKTTTSIDELQKEINRGIQLNMKNVHSSVEELCERILNSNDVKSILKERIIVQKSTVPIETLKELHFIIKNFFIQNLEKLNKVIIQSNNNNVKITETNVNEFVMKHFKLVNIPEFLAEGSAVNNLINPDRVVIGYLLESAQSKFASKVIKSFYEKWVSNDKIIELDSNSSELTKLVSNALLGQRISSINSITELCELTNSNVNKVSESVGMDTRIGKTYLKASMGFGGSCLKKDILSLIYILSSRSLDLQANYWTQVVLMNEYQRLRIANMILNTANNTENKTVSIFGLAFKGNTNDTRGSNAIYLISYLINNKVAINLYDPLVEKKDIENELKLYEIITNEDSELEDLKYIKYSTSYREGLENSSVLVFCNNHSFFSNLDLNELYGYMNENSSVFDLYDIFDVNKIKETKFKIFKLGVYNDINS